MDFINIFIIHGKFKSFESASIILNYLLKSL